MVTSLRQELGVDFPEVPILHELPGFVHNMLASIDKVVGAVHKSGIVRGLVDGSLGKHGHYPGSYLSSGRRETKSWNAGPEGKALFMLSVVGIDYLVVSEGGIQQFSMILPYT